MRSAPRRAARISYYLSVRYIPKRLPAKGYAPASMPGLGSRIREQRASGNRPLAPSIEAESLLFERRYIGDVLGKQPAQEKDDRYVQEHLQNGITDQIPCLQL